MKKKSFYLIIILIVIGLLGYKYVYDTDERNNLDYGNDAYIDSMYTKKEQSEITSVPKKVINNIIKNDGKLDKKYKKNITSKDLISKLNPKKKIFDYENIVMVTGPGIWIKFEELKEDEYELRYEANSSYMDSIKNSSPIVETHVSINLILQKGKINKLDNSIVKKGTKIEVCNGYSIFSALEKRDDIWVIIDAIDNFDSPDNWYFYKDYLNRVV